MQKLKEKLLAAVPVDWKRIDKSDYKSQGIYQTNDFYLAGGYITSDRTISINIYNDKDFIEDYKEYIEELSSDVQGEDLTEMAHILPTISRQVIVNDKKLYICVFEIKGLGDRVSVQIFHKAEFPIGFFTLMPKAEEYDFENLFKTEKTFNQIVKILK